MRVLKTRVIFHITYLTLTLMTLALLSPPTAAARSQLQCRNSLAQFIAKHKSINLTQRITLAYKKVLIDLQTKYGFRTVETANAGSYMDHRKKVIGVNSELRSDEKFINVLHESVHASDLMRMIKNPFPQNLSWRIDFVRADRGTISSKLDSDMYNEEHYLDEIKAHNKTAKFRDELGELLMADGTPNNQMARSGFDRRKAHQLALVDEDLLNQAIEVVSASLKKSLFSFQAPHGIDFIAESSELINDDIVNLGFPLETSEGKTIFVFVPYFEKAIRMHLANLNSFEATTAVLETLKSGLEHVRQQEW